MSVSGVVFYRGPSLLTGDPIVGIASGISGESNNPKTGPMVQVYVLRSDVGPMDAVRSGADEAICGDCALRGDGGFNRRCYVTPFFGPLQIWKQFVAGEYPDVTWAELRSVIEGRGVRLCAYGDPSAVGYEVWCNLLETASTWTGYTHAWRRADQRLRRICMASVDTVDEFYAARALGWRTFRIRMPDAPLLVGSAPASTVGQSTTVSIEFICPASDEADHRSTCQRCQLCRGASSPARSVVIVAHGKPSNLKAFGIRAPFFRSRHEASEVTA